MSTSTQPLTLHSLMGNHAHAKALKSGAVSSPLFTFDFVDEKTPNRAFKRVVRDLEFDFCELAIVTYLQARAKGVPLVMLPATVVGRYQQPFIAYNPVRGAKVIAFARQVLDQAAPLTGASHKDATGYTVVTAPTTTTFTFVLDRTLGGPSDTVSNTPTTPTMTRWATTATQRMGRATRRATVSG